MPKLEYADSGLNITPIIISLLLQLGSTKLFKIQREQQIILYISCTDTIKYNSTCNILTNCVLISGDSEPDPVRHLPQDGNQELGGTDQ